LAASLVVPAADPRSNYLAHKDEIDEVVQRVLNSGWYILGKEVNAFEKEFAGYLGARVAIGVGNGTDALHLALRACGIGKGDAVITVSHTAVATVAAIELAGATPLLVDIDPSTFTLDTNQVEDAITKFEDRRNAASEGARLKAIVPVHLYGHPADMAGILEIAKRHDLYVIEDCAQSLGASIQGRKTGTWGDIAAFSFYPTKNLGALGDGGALVTNDTALATRARELREYGWGKRYISESRGMNTRLDELQAAVLRVKLKYLDQENMRRQEIAGFYDAQLSATGLVLPRLRGPVTHVYHQYVVRCKRREDLRSFLQARAIGTLVHYPLPVHLQPAYRSVSVPARTEMYETERVCREVLSLPMYPELSDLQIQTVTDHITAWPG